MTRYIYTRTHIHTHADTHMRTLKKGEKERTFSMSEEKR